MRYAGNNIHENNNVHENNYREILIKLIKNNPTCQGNILDDRHLVELDDLLSRHAHLGVEISVAQAAVGRGGVALQYDKSLLRDKTVFTIVHKYLKRKPMGFLGNKRIYFIKVLNDECLSQW